MACATVDIHEHGRPPRTNGGFAVANQEAWKETKFVFRGGRLTCSLDQKEVSLSSRLIASIVAKLYQDAFKGYAGGRLLDLGCGKVPLYAAYRQSITQVICVDWSNTLHPSPHLDQEVDLTQPLPFDDAEFDTIVLSDVLEHIPVPENLWAEMARILRPNGKLIMNVPFFYWLHEQPHDYYRYTEFALRRFAGVAGMKLIELKAIGGVPEVLTDVVSKSAVHVPVVGKMVARILQGGCIWFVGTSLGRKFSAKTSKSFPLGYFLDRGETLSLPHRLAFAAPPL